MLARWPGALEEGNGFNAISGGMTLSRSGVVPLIFKLHNVRDVRSTSARPVMVVAHCIFGICLTSVIVRENGTGSCLGSCLKTSTLWTFVGASDIASRLCRAALRLRWHRNQTDSPHVAVASLKGEQRRTSTAHAILLYVDERLMACGAYLLADPPS